MSLLDKTKISSTKKNTTQITIDKWHTLTGNNGTYKQITKRQEMLYMDVFLAGNLQSTRPTAFRENLHDWRVNTTSWVSYGVQKQQQQQ